MTSLAHDCSALDLVSAPQLAALGTIQQRYGVLSCEETVFVVEVLERSGDLAVADRVAYMVAASKHDQLVVFELDGWYHVARVSRFLNRGQAEALAQFEQGPRLMSLISEQGVTPIL